MYRGREGTHLLMPCSRSSYSGARRPLYRYTSWRYHLLYIPGSPVHSTRLPLGGFSPHLMNLGNCLRVTSLGPASRTGSQTYRLRQRSRARLYARCILKWPLVNLQVVNGKESVAFLGSAAKHQSHLQASEMNDDHYDRRGLT